MNHDPGRATAGWLAVITGAIFLAVLLITGPPEGDLRPGTPVVAITPATGSTP